MMDATVVIDWKQREPGMPARGDAPSNLMTIREAFTLAALQGLAANEWRNMGLDWCASMAVKFADKALDELAK